MDPVNILSSAQSVYSGLIDVASRNAALSSVDGEVAHVALPISQGAQGMRLGDEKVNFDWISETNRNKAGQKAQALNQLDDTLKNLVGKFGTKDEKGTIAHGLNTFVTNLIAMSDPSRSDSVSLGVRDFQNVLDDFQTLQRTVTEQRRMIVSEENSAILQINQIIKDIAIVNIPIRTPEQETILCKKMNELSQLIDIEVQFQNDATHSGVAKVFLAGQSNAKILDGTNILGSLSYTPVTTTTPGQSLGSITFTSGSVTLDLRNYISGGILGGLKMSDNMLTKFNSTLDQFALQFMNKVNEVHNEGTSAQYAPSTLTGEIGLRGIEGTALTNATVISGQGTWRIAMHDTNGKIVDYKDIALTTNMTMGGLINTINTSPYVLGNGATFTASLTADGRFQIASGNVNNKISLGFVDGAKANLCAGAAFDSTAATNPSAFFHMNDLISRRSTNPTDLSNGLFSNLQIRTGIQNNPALLAGSIQSSQALLAATDFVVPNAGRANFDHLQNVFSSGVVSFAAAGDMPAISTNILDYATSITSMVVNQRTNSGASAKAAQQIYDNAKLQAAQKSGKTTPEEQLKIMTETQRRIEAIEACLAKTLRMEHETMRTLLIDIR